MKSIILLIISIFSFGYTHNPAKKTISLDEALRLGYIKLKVTGLGGYSGQCLEASVTNNGSHQVDIIIKPGIIFHPEDPTMQDILIVKEQPLSLDKKSSKKIKLTGCCCKADNRSPAAGTTFKIIKTKNTKLSEIAAYLNKNKFSNDVMQNAVWCVSDNKNVSHIYHDKPEMVKALREEVCKITGQENNWFNTNVDRTINNQGYIQSEPVKITGDIVVKLEKPTKLFQGVYKENNEVAWEPHEVANITTTGTMTYQFKLQVKGWEKGKYYVKVTGSGKELLKQEFEI